MSADPAPRTAALPLHEVVLEPQSLSAADDSQDRSGPPPARRPIPVGYGSGRAIDQLSRNASYARPGG